MRAPRGLVAAVALAVSAAACGDDSPTGPGASLNLAGTWTGTWQFVSAGTTVTDEVTATLTQNGASVTGTWSSAGGASGQIAMNADADLEGTISITQALLARPPCTGQTVFSGSASAAALDFTLANYTSSGVCQWGTGQRYQLRR